jgi:long-chain acyl-CoA synthetase
MQKYAFPKTICEAYTQRVKTQGDRVGFRFKRNGKWVPVTFREHSVVTRRLACGLLEKGVKAGDRVSILAQTSLDWSQFDFAILSCGAITVPVYPTSTSEDTNYILNHAESVALFVDELKNLEKVITLAADLPKLKLVVVNFDFRSQDVEAPFEIVHWNTLSDIGLNSEGVRSAQVDKALSSAQPSDVFTICYTSGTTGVPKGVVLTHSSVCSVMEDVYKAIGPYCTEEEDLLTFLPMSHIFGKWESMTPTFLGWTCNFAENIDSLVANLAEVRPTLWVAVPRIFEKVYSKILMQVESGPAVRRKLFEWAVGVGREVVEARDAGQRPGPFLAAQYEVAKRLVFSKVVARFGGRLKFCVSGSAPLAKEIQLFMHSVGVPVFEGYGLTETCAPVSVNLPKENRFGSVGRLFPEVLLKIAEDGEILIKSAKNFKEYYRDPASTKEAIREGWFYTGDIGAIDGDGYLKITDRKKDLIKTAGGKFIAPQKIENLAKGQKLLSQIVVYGDQKPFAVALVTLNQEAVLQFAKGKKILFGDYAELMKKTEIVEAVDGAMAAINTHLAKYESIKKYIILPAEFTVETGDLTPSLKIKRKLICKKFEKELEGLYRD